MSSASAAEAAPAPQERAPRVAVARNAFHLVLGQVTTTALGILMSAALGRTLGASDFGLYFLVVSMAGFAAVFMEWGQLLFVVREVAREPHRAGALLGTALLLRIAGAAAVSVPTWIATRALGYDLRTSAYAVAFIWVGLPFSLAQAFGMVFRARDRMGLDATVSVVNKVVALGLTVLLLLLGAGIPGVMLAQVLAGLGALLMASGLFRRLHAGALSASRQTARALVGGGAPIVAMTVAVAIQPYLDVVVLSKLVPAAPMGWYGAAKSIIGTLFAPAAILASACYPRISRAASDPEALRTELRVAFRPILWVGALGGLGTFLFADVAVGLIYGAKGFAPAGVILKVFAVGLFLMFVDVLLGHVITATGKAPGFAVTKAVSVAVSTALDFLLIPYFQQHGGNGGIGVIAAFVSSEVVVLGGALYLLPRRSLDRAILVDVARALGAAGVTGLLFVLLPPLSPFLAIPLCVVAFAAASLVFRLATAADVVLLRELLRPGRAR